MSFLKSILTFIKKRSAKKSKSYAAGYSAALSDVLLSLPSSRYEGVRDAYWGDTGFDSQSAAYGFNEAVDYVRENISHSKARLN